MVSNDFNLYMLLSEKNTSKQKTVHSSMAYYVHVLYYITQQNRWLDALNRVL
jgi:hypothetical protein